jgi:ankyrin repeat protein
MPRKPWRDIYLDALRRRIEDDRYAHELLMLRVTTKPGRSALSSPRRVGSATHRAQRADASGLGALRLDRPVSLRRALEKQPRLDVNHRSLTYGGRTLLGIAARLGSPSCAKELINGFGADVDVVDDEGWSPLMEAAFRGNEVLALFLLENGAINEGVLGARPDALVLESEEDDEKGLRKRAFDASTKRKRKTSDERREPEPETRARREGVGAARAANEWARARGNVRLAAMIERHQRGERIDWRLESGGELVKTNVTPFSI